MSDVLQNPSADLATEFLPPAGGSVTATEHSDLPVSPNSPNPRSPESHGMIHAIQSLLYIIIVAIFIITFTVQPFRIPSESMDPTLLVGDFLLVAKQNFPATSGSIPLPSTPIRRGDVIVFHFPVDPSIHLVKRVIGLPGDHLRLHGNHVYIDGQPLDEPYAIYRPGPAEPFRDNFPRLSNPDPDVASAWWIQMRSLVNHGELTVPPPQLLRPRRQPQQQRGQPLLGIRPRLRHRWKAAADLLLRQLHPAPRRPRRHPRPRSHPPRLRAPHRQPRKALHPERDRQLRPLEPHPPRRSLTHRTSWGITLCPIHRSLTAMNGTEPPNPIQRYTGRAPPEIHRDEDRRPAHQRI